MKSIKYFDERLNKWVILAANNARALITQNTKLIMEGETYITVEEALNRLASRCEELKGNVAWLAQYGGGGSGGGGSQSTTASIKVVNSLGNEIVAGDNVFNSTKDFTFNYYINQPVGSGTYYVTVYWDGVAIVNEKATSSKTYNPITIQMDKYSSSNVHTLRITAYDSNDLTLEDYVSNITESSISLSAKSNKIEANIDADDTIITLNIHNKAANSTTILHATAQGKTYDFNLGTSDGSNKVQEISIYNKLFEKRDLVVGNTYKVLFQVSNNMGISSDTIPVDIIVKNAKTLLVLVDGITTDKDIESGTEITSFVKNSNIVFTITPYISNSNYIYAAYQVYINNQLVNTVGDHFNDATVSNYIQNLVLDQGSPKSFYIDTSASEFTAGSEIKIVFRAWAGSDFNITKDIIMKGTLSEGTNKLFTDQDLSSVYARWCHKSSSEKVVFPLSTKDEWNSVRNYSDGITTKEVTTKLTLYQCNGVTAGFIQNENRQNVIRLFNNGYGRIDFNPFSYDPLGDSTIGNHWQTGDFTISLTFKSDKAPNPENTIFFCGGYNNNGSFQSGIKVDLNKVYWYYQDEGPTGEAHKITASIEQEVINTIDFVCKYDTASVKQGGTVYIYINGICTAANTFIGQPFMLNSCNPVLGGSIIDNNITKQCDVDFYDIKFVKKALTPKSIVINYMNAHANANADTNGADYRWYNKKKIANLFIEDSLGNVNSILYNNGEWTDVDFTSLTTALHQAGSTLPVLLLTMDEGSPFTESQYVMPATKQSRLFTDWSQATGQYYDPVSDKTIIFNSNTNGTLGVKIQGTSSLTYRSKNLEIKLFGIAYTFGGKAITRVDGQEALFQPKANWMPENQFTLKADNMDSSHANNASIGNYINASGLMENTPPMEYVKNNPPKETANIVNGEEVKTHKECTVKHTLEGFPCIVLMKFAGSRETKFLGIYSFNLGRAAYYNMGFKFLNDFSHSKWNGTMFVKDSIDQYPYVINTYSEVQTDVISEKIVQSKTYSFEFNDNLNTPVDNNTRIFTQNPYGLFWQGDMSCVKKCGEFKYNGFTKSDADVSDDAEVWKGLQSLFELTASMVEHGGQLYYSDNETKFNAIGVPKYAYDPIKGYYILYEKTQALNSNGQPMTDKTGKPIYAPLYYPATNNWSSYVRTLEEKLNISTAFAYFIICMIFGLVDSLGKNMTLRTWDGGKTWYCVFYDMDTANGESNTGYETVLETAYIHRLTNQIKDNNHKLNTLKILYNDAHNGFDQYSSRLWDILESIYFTQEQTSATKDTFSSIWNKIRDQKTTILNEQGLTEINKSCLDNYVDYFFKTQLESCGEMVFNYDYYVKYLVKYNKTTGALDNASGEYNNIRFLHGTRVNYVKNWLHNRWIFLDGVFDYTGTTVIQPYNKMSTLLARGNEKEIKITIRTASPFIFQFIPGNAGTPYKYFIPKNEDTEITLPQFYASNTTCIFNGSNIITKLDNLSVGGLGLEGFGATGTTLPLLEELNLANDTYLNNNPIEFKSIFFVDGKSYMKKINLTGTRWGSKNSREYSVNVANYDKLISLNISNSDVQSVSLPQSSLQKLSVYNSNINALDLVNQIYLESIDFTDCKQLSAITIKNCSKLSELVLDNMLNLERIEAALNKGLSKLTISSCNKVNLVDVENNEGLSSFTLTKCLRGSINVTLRNNNNLQTLDISNTVFTSPINISGDLSNVNSVNLYNSNIDSIKFNTEAIPEYQGDNVLDFTKFTNLSSFNVSKMTNLKYLKVKNIQDEPININRNTFRDDKNLKRIFGHYKITENGIFYELGNFRIREPKLVNGVTPLEVPDFVATDNSNNGFVTNFIIGTNNINSLFFSTNTSLTDVYYILSLCSNVTSASALFMWSKQVALTKQNSFNKEAFKYCTNMVDLSQAFDGKFTGESILFSNEHDDNGVTKYNGTLSYLRNCTNISNMFNGKCVWYVDDYILSGTDATTPIKWDLNSAIEFAKVWVNNTNSDLRETQPSLYKILSPLQSKNITSFNTFLNTDTTIKFSEGNNDTEVFKLFPNLVSISNSFNIKKALGKIENPWRFNTGTLEVVDNSFNFSSDENGTKNLAGIEVIYNNNWFANTPKLRVFRNSFNIEKKAKVFPYNIFRPCASTIEDISGFFQFLTLEDITEQALPNNMFKGCTRLQVINNLFRKCNFKYHLISKGFIDCNLTSVYKAFGQTENYYQYKDSKWFYNRIGQIPYGLFMMTYNGELTYPYEGISDTDAALIDINSTSKLTLKSYTIPMQGLFKHTINNMQAVLTGSEGDAESYKTSLLSQEDAMNLVIPNEKYNPIKYILNPLWYEGSTEKYLIENPDYNPYKKVFNKWYYDGFTNKETIRQALTTYNIDTSEVDMSTFDTIFTGDLVYNVSSSEYNYYAIPADLYRYCTTKANINSSLTNNGFTSDENHLRGIVGRIPKFIFEPLADVTSMSNVFSNCKSVSPYDFGEGSSMGKMFHEDMYKYLPKVNSLQSITEGIVIPANVGIHQDSFVNNKLLTSVSGMYSDVQFNDNVNIQVPDNLFRANFSLANVSSLFSRSSLKKVNFVNLLTKVNHPNLSNVSYFMSESSQVTGTIPIFWLVNSNAIEKTFYQVSKSKILNEQDYTTQNGINFYTLYCSDMSA